MFSFGYLWFKCHVYKEVHLIQGHKVCISCVFSELFYNLDLLHFVVFFDKYFTLIYIQNDIWGQIYSFTFGDIPLSTCNLLKDYNFPLELSWQLWKIWLIINVGYISKLPSISINLCCLFLEYTHWLLKVLVVKFEIRKCMSSNFCSFSKYFFDYSVSWISIWNLESTCQFQKDSAVLETFDRLYWI